VGADPGAAAAASVFRLLADRWSYFFPFPPSRKKIFKKSENFVCICEKMGYNKV
jgi:hypothetical protein